MLTQCPQCQATFRVTALQLKAKAGRVRCGRCHAAFNALEHLHDVADATLGVLPEDHSTPQPMVTSTATLVANTSIAESDANADNNLIDEADEATGSLDFVTSPLENQSRVKENLSVENLPNDTLRGTVKDDFLSQQASDNAESSPLEATTLTDPEASAENRTPQVQTDILLDRPLNAPDAPAYPSDRLAYSWMWPVGCGLLIALLVVQAFTVFHGALGRQFPATIPFISVICQQVSCPPAALPAQAALISIESSDLTPDPTQSGRLVVSATLKNRATVAQQYPHLELTLTDIANRAILRKVFSPAIYLQPDSLIEKGMHPLSDSTVSLEIDIHPLAASGYRLYVFYP
ncbi:MAG: DUF3426 domain-containing protein [Rugosibacter sp.]|nr:DUF3426 domain-containing protein [Rugosibacter sp.]